MLDRLLEWCSERETGSVKAFREAHEWLARRFGASDRRTAALALRRLEELGHLEVDYQADKWAIAPPVVAALEDSGGIAVLVGGRPRRLMRRLWALEDDPDPRVRDLSSFVFPETLPSLDPTESPSAIVMSNRADEILDELCKALEIRFEHRASRRISRVLPSIDAYLGVGAVITAPPGFEPRRMEFRERIEFRPVETDSTPGAYEYVRYGPARYIFNDGDGLFQADRRIVVYAELRRKGHNVLMYKRSSQQMLVPGTCPLPLLYARSAVLRTGQPPSFVRQPSQVAQQRPVNLYENIPEHLFLRICEGLGQSPVWA
jgi:hypothetical protein